MDTDKYNRYSYTLRKTILAFIGIDMLFSYISAPWKLLIYTSLFMIVIYNDYLRDRGFFYNGNDSLVKHYASLIFSMTCGAALIYFSKGYAHIYMFLLINDIVFSTKGLHLTIMLTLHLFLIFTVEILRLLSYYSLLELLSMNFILENAYHLSFSLVFIVGLVIFNLQYKSNLIEKDKVTRLNKELAESYKKLKIYSEKIEELTVAKERQRLAQEIHDSLGHYLTATIMHLDYIEKIVLTDSVKAHEVIKKTQNLAKSSIDQVRMAVNTLKDSHPLEKGILPVIKEMTEAIEITEKISVRCNIDMKIEALDPSIKSAIFRSIQECLTNSLRHGKVSEIGIEAGFKGKNLSLTFTDNGIGCEKIIKGNGILGIEERINMLNGRTCYQSQLGQGFSMTISIPIEEAHHEKDKTGTC